jgi:hypothetical protein
MKLFRNNKVYVQMNDVMFAMNHSNAIPAVIVNQIFKDVVIVTNENRMDFVSFDDKVAIDYFRKLDFIVNYDDYKDLSIEELDAKAEIILKKIKDIVDKYNNLSSKKIRENQELINEYEKLEYVINYLGEIRGIKLGTNHMDIPGEILDNIPVEIIDTESNTKTSEPKKKSIKTFIKEKIFNKR